MKDVPKHTQASLWPGELVTIGMLRAIKGVGNRAFYRWLTRDFHPLFPNLPHRTRRVNSWVALEDCSSRPPADPDVRISRIRLLRPELRGVGRARSGRRGEEGGGIAPGAGQTKPNS